MTVFISMIRGVNVGGHGKIKMDSLRTLYESLGFEGAQTHIQSGNVVFRTKARDSVQLAKRLGDGIEGTFGFRPSVILRTTSELRDVLSRNPFANRRGIDPSKVLITFLAAEPEAQMREKVLNLKIEPEELRFQGRELYIYFPHGMARPKFSWSAVERLLKLPGTGRNWNTARKLLEMAEKMEAT